MGINDPKTTMKTEGYIVNNLCIALVQVTALVLVIHIIKVTQYEWNNSKEEVSRWWLDTSWCI